MTNQIIPRNIGPSTPVRKRLSDARIGEYGLFAIASEKRARVNGVVMWVPAGIFYVHAPDAKAARVEYYRSHDVRGKTRIVANGHVVGYFVNDAHGDELSV